MQDDPVVLLDGAPDELCAGPSAGTNLVEEIPVRDGQ